FRPPVAGLPRSIRLEDRRRWKDRRPFRVLGPAVDGERQRETRVGAGATIARSHLRSPLHAPLDPELEGILLVPDPLSDQITELIGILPSLFVGVSLHSALPGSTFRSPAGAARYGHAPRGADPRRRRLCLSSAA